MYKNRKQNLFNILIASLFAASLFCSCEKSTDVYSGDNYIYFTKDASKDSLTYNFGYHGTPATDRIGIEVNITGAVVNYDRQYAVNVSKLSQLIEGTHFNIDESTLKISSGNVKDTLWLTIKNNPDLLNSKKILVLELEQNNNFDLIFQEKMIAKIYLTDIISQPTWWNDWHLEEGLGEYSEVKYREFIKVTKQYDLSETTMSFENRRNYLLQFKYHLMEMSDKGEPVMDGDKPMTVKIYG